MEDSGVKGRGLKSNSFILWQLNDYAVETPTPSVEPTTTAKWPKRKRRASIIDPTREDPPVKRRRTASPPPTVSVPPPLSEPAVEEGVRRDDGDKLVLAPLQIPDEAAAAPAPTSTPQLSLYDPDDLELVNFITISTVTIPVYNRDEFSMFGRKTCRENAIETSPLADDLLHDSFDLDMDLEFFQPQMVEQVVLLDDLEDEDEEDEYFSEEIQMLDEEEMMLYQDIYREANEHSQLLTMNDIRMIARELGEDVVSSDSDED